MPDIIEGFFKDFGYQSSDFYKLVPLNPQFEMVFADGNIEVPEKYEALRNLFEQLEYGSGNKLDQFMRSAKFKYEVSMKEFVNKPCHNWREFLSPKIAGSALKLDLLSNFRTYVAQYFANPKLRSLMEFPVIFLGASPKNIPALYSFMNYWGYALGTWYPMGGYYHLALAMQNIAEKQGVAACSKHDGNERRGPLRDQSGFALSSCQMVSLPRWKSFGRLLKWRRCLPGKRFETCRRCRLPHS